MPKILVIDDDAAARRMIGRILADARFQVIEAADGVEGLALYRSEAPDLIVTDIIMPEKEGIQTIADVRACGSKTSIIAISGGGAGGESLYLSMAEELGADAALAKPFRPAELLSLVEQLLNRDTTRVVTASADE